MKEKEEERLENMLEIEKKLYEKGYKLVCGVDEAGRGPLCGPVVAAAVILKEGQKIEGVNDSKKISEKKREVVYKEIMDNALAIGVGIRDEKIIDEINILNATKEAMIDAINNLKIKPEYVLIDGNQKIDINIPEETVVHGDAKSESIAAASIIAKVTRDHMIISLSNKYPEYNLSKNKGYGTKEHIEAIKKYGLSDIHRRTFCTHFVKEEK